MANTCLNNLISTPTGVIGAFSLWGLYSYLLITKAYPHFKDTLNDDSDLNTSILIAALIVFGGGVPFVTGATLGRLLEACVIKGGEMTKEKCAKFRQNISFFTPPGSDTIDDRCEVSVNNVSSSSSSV